MKPLFFINYTSILVVCVKTSVASAFSLKFTELSSFTICASYIVIKDSSTHSKSILSAISRNTVTFTFAPFSFVRKNPLTPFEYIIIYKKSLREIFHYNVNNFNSTVSLKMSYITSIYIYAHLLTLPATPLTVTLVRLSKCRNSRNSCLGAYKHSFQL